MTRIITWLGNVYFCELIFSKPNPDYDFGGLDEFGLLDKPMGNNVNNPKPKSGPNTAFDDNFL
jgi:hypothetical protein